MDALKQRAIRWMLGMAVFGFGGWGVWSLHGLAYADNPPPARSPSPHKTTQTSSRNKSPKRTKTTKRTKKTARRFFKRRTTRKRRASRFFRIPWRRKPRPPRRPVWKDNVQQMVATAHPLATQAALDMLKQGGNAMDAAVAAGFVLSVVEPYSSGIGGGGFLLYYDAHKKHLKALDFRERAPLKSDPQMYARHDEKTAEKLSKEGHLAAAVPGMVAGLAEAAYAYSLLPWTKLLEPAHKHAKEGFPVYRRLAGALRYAKPKLRKFRATRSIFLKRGKPFEKGEILKQDHLAWTISQIQRFGPYAFYQGRVAHYILREMQKGGGLISADDLKAYKPLWVQPVVGRYRGYTIYSMGSPSSGGTHLIQMLNILSGFPLHNMKLRDPQRMHLVVEAMRLAFADRARYQGDARFVKVPTHGLTSPKYAALLRKRISAQRATPDGSIQAGDPYPFNHKHTTHVSIIDRWGNAASMTLTINTTFGSGVVVDGTGILLNNQMDDFTTLPGKPNAYKLIQSVNNTIAPGKSPLSSMTPTLIFDEKSLLRGAIGSPGGPTIITTVLQLILHLIDQGIQVEEAMKFPRLHHQWQPAHLFVESKLRTRHTLQGLQKLGHTLKRKPWWGNAMALWVTKWRQLTGAADPRGDGSAEGF
ncbi:gamma-glutamyltransferase [Myxococcota bacterium]|nr:gamma-glutamyltransferase [Myxococcota bacterium]